MAVIPLISCFPALFPFPFPVAQGCVMGVAGKLGFSLSGYGGNEACEPEGLVMGTSPHMAVSKLPL